MFVFCMYALTISILLNQSDEGLSGKYTVIHHAAPMVPLDDLYFLNSNASAPHSCVQ